MQKERWMLLAQEEESSQSKVWLRQSIQWLESIGLRQGGSAAIDDYLDGEYTCLMVACRYGDRVLAQRSLSHGAKVDHSSFSLGYTALHVACQNGQDALVAWLLRMGADVNKRCAAGKTPLMLAVQYADMGLVMYLLHHGANVALSVPKTGETAYYFACGRNNLLMAPTLKKYGANHAVVSHSGMTPLMYAVQSQAGLVLDYLLQMADAKLDAQNYAGETALMMAVSLGDLRIVRKLVTKGAQLEVRNNRGETALLWAVIRRYHVMVQYLVGQGADVACRCDKARDALYWASTLGDGVLVAWLLRHPAYGYGYDGFYQAISEAAVQGFRKVLVLYQAVLSCYVDQQSIGAIIQAVLQRGRDSSVLTVLLPLLQVCSADSLAVFVQAAQNSQDARACRLLSSYGKQRQRLMCQQQRLGERFKMPNHGNGSLGRK